MNHETNRMARVAPAELHALIAANARLWAGEAEVFSTYFAPAARSPASDGIWLARQCYKELVDGVATRLARVTATVADFATTDVRATEALRDQVAQEELKHYIAFAIAHRISRAEAGAVMAAHESSVMGEDWPENRALMVLRVRHVREFGALGRRAQAFTEGGYCTLYNAGAALAGGGVLDDSIARACDQVLDDEWEHMLEGIADLADDPLGSADWAVIERLTVEQGRLRIRMRNAQFGYPLTPRRVLELEGGVAGPLSFDYTRAGLLPP